MAKHYKIKPQAGQYIKREDIPDDETYQRIVDWAEDGGFPPSNDDVRKGFSGHNGLFIADINSSIMRYKDNTQLRLAHPPLTPADIFWDWPGVWHKWEGGKCPIDPDTVVEVKLQDATFKEGNARDFAWWVDLPPRVLRYRVIPVDTKVVKRERANQLQEIVDAMREHPDDWVDRFEWHDTSPTVAPNEHLFWSWWASGFVPYRRPQTVHVSGEVSREAIEDAREVRRDDGRTFSNKSRAVAEALLLLIQEPE